MINEILRAFGLYDLRGLKHSIKHLESVFGDIPFWNIRQQAKYVDKRTRQHVNYYPDTIRRYMWSFDDRNWFLDPAVNTTSIGNVAYIGLKHPDQATRTKARKMLDDYENYLTGMAEKRETENDK